MVLFMTALEQVISCVGAGLLLTMVVLPYYVVNRGDAGMGELLILL